MKLASPGTSDVLDVFVAATRARNKVARRDWAALADWYAWRVQSGDRDPASTAVARHPGTSAKTWQNRFSRCRSVEPPLLTAPPRRGVAGGLLTEHAMSLLGWSDREPDEELREEYERTRESGRIGLVAQPPRRRESRTENWLDPDLLDARAQPRRSMFGSAEEFEAAWDLWEDGRPWEEPRPARVEHWARSMEGVESVERYDDWFERMSESEREMEPDTEWTDDLGTQVLDVDLATDLRHLWVARRREFEVDVELADLWRQRLAELEPEPDYQDP